MTYASEIAKTEQGNFAEIYDITIGDEQFFYTSYDAEINFGGQNYTPKPVKRGVLQQDSKLRSTKLEVNFPLTEPAVRFVASSPPENVSLIIRRFFLDDESAVKVIFVGQLISIQISKKAAKGIFENRTKTFRNKIPPIVYSPACKHRLYDDGCKLNEDDFRVDGTVTVSGSQLTSAEYATKPDDFFTIGRARFDGDERFITKHLGDTITLIAPFPDLKNGQIVSAFAGCNKLIDTCIDKFDNLENYLGFPFIPSKNIVIHGFDV